MFDTEALADYTQGRLGADDDETERILARSLAHVRRWCGWHVAPVLTQTLTLDGPGGPVLVLPTQNLLDVTAVTENGVTLTLAGLAWSRRGIVEKKLQQPMPINYFGIDRYFRYNQLPWNFWTDQLSAINVTFQHGYADAPDFEEAVFSVADRMSQETTGGAPVSIGPFRWSGVDKIPGSPFTAAEASILDKFRLEQSA